MALKAGYVGVKRWLYEKLQAITTKNVQDINGISETIAVTGMKNFQKPDSLSSSEVRGVTFTPAYDSDGNLLYIEADGKAVGGNASYVVNNSNMKLPAGKYIFSAASGGSASTYNAWVSNWGDSKNYFDNGDGVEFTLSEAKTAGYCALRVMENVTVNHVRYYPMVRSASDPSKVYAPYAMTNQQLTASVDDQKTTINAIISAATGAADFAAFKTAMAAITPVTRSVAPETRGEVTDDPEPVTKTTRKSTKKEDN